MLMYYLLCQRLNSLGRGGAQKGGGEAALAYIISTMNTPHRISNVLPTA